MATAHETSNTNQEATLLPITHIHQTADGSYVLEAEMPGVGRDGIDVSVEGNELTLIGKRSLSFPQEATPLRREIRAHNFKRVFELDASIDTSRISAKIEQGVLRVVLPLSERVKPRKIEVLSVND
ncbi:MAG: Hsp20/alpha crystallin family protein [Verrucomicrobiales bacterium]